MNAYYNSILNDPKLADHQLALGAVCELLDRRWRANAPPTTRSEALSLIELSNDWGKAVGNGEGILRAAFHKGVLGLHRPEPVEDPAMGIPVRPPAHVKPPAIQSMQSHLRGLAWGSLKSHDPAAQSLMKQVDTLASRTTRAAGRIADAPASALEDKDCDWSP